MRKQYPSTYSPLDRDELLLDDTLTQEISPLVRKTREWQEWNRGPKWPSRLQDQQLCQHTDSGLDCKCAIPFQARKVASFLHKQMKAERNFDEVNGAGYFSLQLIQILLIQGEMDVLLRLCAQPEKHLRSWFYVQECQRGAMVCMSSSVCVSGLVCII